MTGETFIEKFEALIDTPNAVGQMRALILSLAASGKLVQQDPGDEPASKLVVRIQAALDGLRAKKQAAVEPIDPDDFPRLPDTWEWVRLGNVVEYGSSDKVESSEIKPHDWLLDLEDIEKDTSRLLQRKTFRDSPSLSTKARFQTDDVLYGKLRPYLNKVLVANAKGYCTTEIIPIRAHGFIDPKFLCYALKRPDFISYAVSKCYGMNLPRLGTDDARRAPFPLPPLAEQKRIVAKVDELMALCDRLETQQKTREAKHAILTRATVARFTDVPAPENLALLFHGSYSIGPGELRNAILTMAVQGRLVAQNLDEESAEDFLARVGLKNGRYEDDADIVPESWTRVRFEDVATVTGGVTLGRKLDDRKSVTLPYLRTANVQRGGFNLDLIKEVSIGADEIERFALKHDDLLMVEGGDWDKVGRAAIWKAQIPNCLHQNHIFRARMRSTELLPEWFERFFNSPFGRRYFESASKQTTNLASINMRQVRSCPVPLPPPAEQRRIVAKVNQLMALVDRLEAHLADSRALGERLMEAVVAQLTGVKQQRRERMKAPKIEIVSMIRLKKRSKIPPGAQLAPLLAKRDGELDAKALWTLSKLPIHTFYKQLRQEIQNGWIAEPEEPTVRERG